MSFNNIFLIIIIIVICYLIYILYKSDDKPKNIKKTVRFFGLPSEIDNVKPKFITEPLSDKSLLGSNFNPINSLDKYINNSLDF